MREDLPGEVKRFIDVRESVLLADEVQEAGALHGYERLSVDTGEECESCIPPHDTQGSFLFIVRGLDYECFT